MMHAFRARVGVAGLRRINQHLLAPLLAAYRLAAVVGGTDRRHRSARRLCRLQKKAPGDSPPRTPPWAGARSRPGKADASSATRSTRFASGCTSIRSGCCWCRWSVGSRPPMFPRAGCWSQPALLPAAMGLVSAAGRGGHGVFGAAAKQRCRERWRVAVLTKLRSDMKLVPPYVAWNQAACPQGDQYGIIRSNRPVNQLADAYDCKPRRSSAYSPALLDAAIILLCLLMAGRSRNLYRCYLLPRAWL